MNTQTQPTTSEQPCRITYLNSARIKNPQLLPSLNQVRHSIWLYTGNAEFDEVLDQRLFDVADIAVKHFEEGCYESCIAMCATAAEMLTYFLFFVHTNSLKVPAKEEFLSKKDFEIIRNGMNQANQSRAPQIEKRECKEIDFGSSFGEKGNRADRSAVLRNSKIRKQDYSINGEGHDVSKICDLLDAIHLKRIKYLHRWTLFSESQRITDAEQCIVLLFDAMGHVFETDPSDQGGVVKINSSINKLVAQYSS
jgi:hypothetical protein